jgi:hypothetical protein
MKTYAKPINHCIPFSSRFQEKAFAINQFVSGLVTNWAIFPYGFSWNKQVDPFTPTGLGFLFTGSQPVLVKS